MASRIKTTGEWEVVRPANGKNFERSELESLCGVKGIEIAALGRPKRGRDVGEEFPMMDGIKQPAFIAVDGAGLVKHVPLPLNRTATELYKRHGGSLLLGDVVILSRSELPKE